MIRRLLSPLSGLRLRSTWPLARCGRGESPPLDLDESAKAPLTCDPPSLTRQDLLFLLVAAVFSALAALPLFGRYFVGSHDGVLAVYRFFEFDRSIQDGILVPRWAPDLFFGYGYPFFNFYAPLSYYMAEVFHHLGAGFVGSVSATFAAGFVLSGVAMYLFARDLGGRWVGLLSALAYVYAPYHLVNAHLRGDLAEFFAFVWFPAILWAAGRMVRRGSLVYLAATSLLYAALLTTHNIMALAFSPLLAAYLVFLLVRQRGDPSLSRKTVLSIGTVALAFGLSAFFWMPALQQVSEIQIGRLANDPSFYFRSSLMQLSSYVSASLLQGYGPRSPSGDYGYPVELGLIQTGMALVAIALPVRACLRRRAVRPPGAGATQGPDTAQSPNTAQLIVRYSPFPSFAFLAVAGLAYYSIMFPWALVLWEKIPLMSYLQSPWRLLPFLILFTSVLVGYLGHWASRIRPGWNGAALSLLALLIVLPNVVNLQPRYVDLDESELTVPGVLRFEMLSQNLGMTAAGEYLPKGVRSKLTSSPLALEAAISGQPPARFDAGFLTDGAQVEVIETRTMLGRFRVRSAQGTPFLFNQTYFPGWTAYLDDHEVTPRGVGTANLMAVDVPAGEHGVEFRFEDTRVRLLGNGLSLASLAAVVVILALSLRRRQRHGAPSRTVKDDQGQSKTTKHDQALSGTTKHYQALPVTALGGLALVALLTGASLLPQLQLSSLHTAPFPVEVSWAGGPGLQGYALGATTARPGEHLSITLYSTDPILQPVRVGLKGHNGQVWSSSEAANTFSSRSVGDIYWQYALGLDIPNDAPPGVYRLSVDVIPDGKPLPITKERLARPVFPEESLLLGPVLVDRHSSTVQGGPTIANRKDAELEKKVTLLGFNLETSGRSLDLTTYWKALSIMREDYSIFAHLEQLDGKALTKNDLQPGASAYPTTLWKPGDVVPVPFHFDLPEGFDPARHQIAVGLYTPDNFQRLSVLDSTGNPVTNTVFLSLTPYR